MPEALFQLLVAICVAAPAPCYGGPAILQIPVMAMPQVDSEDLHTFKYEGVTVKFVQYHPEI